MIDGLRQYAERLAFVRPGFVVLGLAGVGAAGWEILGPGFAGEEDLLLPAVVAIMWSIVGFAAIGLFRDVPPPLEGDADFMTRLGRRLSRGFFYAVALVFIGLTLTGLYMTYKLVSIFAG